MENLIHHGPRRAILPQSLRAEQLIVVVIAVPSIYHDLLPSYCLLKSDSCESIQIVAGFLIKFDSAKSSFQNQSRYEIMGKYIPCQPPTKLHQQVLLLTNISYNTNYHYSLSIAHEPKIHVSMQVSKIVQKTIRLRRMYPMQPNLHLGTPYS